MGGRHSSRWSVSRISYHQKDRSRVPAMQQIAEWLDTLGLSEYAQRFADNDIDTSVLRHLTDQDLKELGVSLGHRRKCWRPSPRWATHLRRRRLHPRTRRRLLLGMRRPP